MAAMDIGTLMVNLQARNDQFSKTMLASQRQLDSTISGMQSKISGFASVAVPAAAAVAVGAIAVKGVMEIGQAAIAASEAAISAAQEQWRAEQKLAAVLTSTGHAAGFSADELRAYAGELQSLTNFGDEVTLNAAAQLATFTSISGDHFKEALARAQDLATVFDTDLKSSVLQIGKALNDPMANMTALRRSGVSFTEQQRETVKLLQEQGDLLGAQRIILDELSVQFGGAAEAMADPMTQVKNVMGDVQEIAGFALLPAVSDIAADIKSWIGDLETARRRAEALALVFQLMVEDVKSMVNQLAQSSMMLRALVTVGGAWLEQFGKNLDRIAEMQELMEKMNGENAGPAFPGVGDNADLADAAEKFTAEMEKLEDQLTVLQSDEPAFTKMEQQAAAIAERIEATAEQTQAIRDLMGEIHATRIDNQMAIQMQKEEETKQRRLESMANRVIQGLMTPFELFQQEVNRLEVLESAGLLSLDQFEAAVRQEQEKLAVPEQLVSPRSGVDFGLSGEQKDLMRLQQGIGPGDKRPEEETAANTAMLVEEAAKAAKYAERTMLDLRALRRGDQVVIGNPTGG